MKADCAIAELPERSDGEWVKVGGMITEAKKIRTRSGTTMMFATLDDLEGSVEVVVFEKALAAAEGVLATDEIVLVRGRVDHKDASKVCIVVQDVDRFDPSDAEIEKAKAAMAERRRARGAQARSSVRVDAARLRGDRHRRPARPVRALPGRDRVRARDAHPHGPAAAPLRRRLPGRRRATRGLRAELRRLLGDASPRSRRPRPSLAAPEPEPAVA